jgi:PEP-CTERM motif
MKRAIQLTLVAAFLTLIAGNVRADSVLLSYTLTGPGTNVTFDLPEFPTSITPLDGIAFYVQPTNLMIDGKSSSDLLVFYTSDDFWGGAFDDVNDTPGFPGLMGDQLYKNGEENPQMVTGPFSLTDYATGTEAFSLEVTPVVSAPESSTMVLFGIGLIALGLMRKRRMATANFSA